VTETTYFLEMTSPAQLVPGTADPDEIVLRAVDASDAALVRETYVRIGEPLGWTGRMAWSDERWHDELDADEVSAWLAVVHDELAGLVELDSTADGDVGIVVLGLVPRFIGRGLGGRLLTMAVERAWSLRLGDSGQPRRVWVQTSSTDHPHALPNYEARGFRIFRTESRDS
jgi:GNAT superfamily N-acetyltransferase